MQIKVFVNAVWGQAMSQSNSYEAKQQAMQLLAVSTETASGEAKRRSKAAVISCRLVIAMPLHRCLYPTIKEQIWATYEWLEEEATVTAGTVWDQTIIGASSLPATKQRWKWRAPGTDMTAKGWLLCRVKLQTNQVPYACLYKVLPHSDLQVRIGPAPSDDCLQG